VCLSCLRLLGAMQSLLLRHSGFPLGMWGFVWIVGLVCYLVWGGLKYKKTCKACSLNSFV
jgi:hypothetical protein